MKKLLIAVIAGVIFLVLILVLGIILSPRDTKKTISSPLLEKAENAVDKTHPIEAKRLYQEMMNEINNPAELKKIQEKIEGINIGIIFSPFIDECSIEYVVKPKDVLVKIAKKYNTTVSLIKRSNNLETDMIKPKQKLKINTCEFSAVVDKSQNLLFLKRAGGVIKTYVVSTGEDGNTPVGNFKIVNKLIKPTWYKTGAVISPDDPENVLGSRWMGFDLKGYGIHGTIEPENLGKQVTLGCIRMKNQDIEELFDIIPVGTEIIIVE